MSTEQLRDVVRLLRRDARHNNIETLPRPDNVEVVGDAVLIERIVESLLANALKHSPKAWAISIAVISSLIKGEVVLFVDDDGPGVPEHQRPLIFEAHVSGGDESA